MFAIEGYLLELCSLNVHVSLLTLVKEVRLGIRSSEDFLLSSFANFYSQQS